MLVPQRVYTDDSAARGYAYADAHFRHPSIEFRAAGIPEPGVRVGKITARYFPSIAGGQDAVFRGPGDREVRVWILVRFFYSVFRRCGVLMGLVFGSGRAMGASRCRGG